MINEITVGFGIIIFAICCVVVYLFIKNKEHVKKYCFLEESIDKLSSEVHQLQKNMQEVRIKEEFARNTLGDTFQNNVETGLSQFYQQLKEMRENIKSERDYFEEKMIRLENRVRDFGYLNNSNDIDEKRIIALFQEGWSVDSIAKELRIGRGEVEFILKLADI